MIGTDTFKRSGDTLSVTHRVHGADDGTYDHYLYDYSDCGEIGYLGKYKVSGGDGSKSNSHRRQRHERKFFTCDLRQPTTDGWTAGSMPRSARTSCILDLRHHLGVLTALRRGGAPSAPVQRLVDEAVGELVVLAPPPRCT